MALGAINIQWTTWPQFNGPHDHMASIQEMISKLDPESTDLHNLGFEKICNNMYSNNTTQIYKNLQHIYKSKFTTHLQTKIYITLTKLFIKYVTRII